MAKVVPFPSRTPVYEEACAWIARHDRGLSTQEEKLFRDWLAEDSAHHSALTEMAGFWGDLEVLSELADLFPLNHSSVARLEHRKRQAKMLLAAGIAFAATVLFAVMASIPELRDGLSSGDRVAAERFETGIGERWNERLPDGSVVTLNTDTEITVAYGEAARDVFLERGEAHFEVTHDPERPFNVHVNGRILRAVGTAFNVRLKDGNEVEVTVTEGKVRIASAPLSTGGGDQPPAESADDTTLVRGEVAIIEPDARHVLRLEPMELDIRLAWQRGMLIFEGESLETVLEEVSRYTTTKFVIADDALRSVRVGGYFRAGDTDGLLVALQENFQIASRIDAERGVMLTLAGR